MRKITVIKPDGSEETHEYKKVDHKILQGFVGGLIEVVPNLNKFNGERCTAYVNEEGQLLPLPFNERATKLWLDQLGKGPFWYEPRLYGNLVIDQKA